MEKTWGLTGYPFPPEFEELANGEWRNAIIDTNGNHCIWEIFSNKTGLVVQTNRVAVTQDEMHCIEYEISDDAKAKAEIDYKINEVIEAINEQRNILRELITGRTRLTYDQYKHIKEVLGD